MLNITHERLLLVAFLLCSLGLLAQQNPSTLPDNTGQNRRDRSSSEVTAEQQQQNKSDLELTRQIRRAVVADKSLSTNAHNVKIISQQGTVTLKGVVKNDEEKQEIEKKAAEIAGGTEKIHNELQVTGDNKEKPSPNYYYHH